MNMGIHSLANLLTFWFHYYEKVNIMIFNFVPFFFREPRGFGFVKYRYAEDAAEAKQQLNHTIIGGREIRIVFAEENRKTPQEMRTTTRVRYNNILFTPILQ